MIWRCSKVFLCLAMILSILECGSSGSRLGVLGRPIDIRASSRDVSVGGRTTRLVFVLDEYFRGVVAIDQALETILSMDERSEFGQIPLAIGGIPVALAVEDKDSSVRIFVADGLERRLFAFDVSPSTELGKNLVAYQSVDLGDSLVGVASRPLFTNTGRSSSPVFSEVVVDPSMAKAEAWFLTYLSESEGYEVRGSISGTQKARAVEGKLYSSDDGAIQWTIQGGGEKTNAGDVFRFGVVVSKPLTLQGIPVDLQVDERNLYVVTVDPAEVVVLDLASLTHVATTPLIDPSGTSPNPGKSSLLNGHLYIANMASSVFFDMDTSAYVVATRDATRATRSLGTHVERNELFLISLLGQAVSLFNPSSQSISDTMDIGEDGLAFASYTLDEKAYGLVSTVAGQVDVIDLETKKRVDTRGDSGVVQSSAFRVTFHDEGTVSSPQLIAISTRDRVTKTEQWQMTYEGVIAGAHKLSATLTGTMLEATQATFVSWNVAPGDRLVIETAGPGEEIAIADVVSETTLVLESSPTRQGAAQIDIRAHAAYVLAGSMSGTQQARVVEGKSYTSDNGSITLTIRPSRVHATTRDDFFAFATLEGIDPIWIPDERMGRSIAVLVPPQRVDPVAYVAAETGSISILNLRALREKRRIQ